MLKKNGIRCGETRPVYPRMVSGLPLGPRLGWPRCAWRTGKPYVEVAEDSVGSVRVTKRDECGVSEHFVERGDPGGEYEPALDGIRSCDHAVIFAGIGSGRDKDNCRPEPFMLCVLDCLGECVRARHHYALNLQMEEGGMDLETVVVG